MDEKHKQRVRERYQRALQHGEKFWPDSIYKDVLVSFALFLLLVGLATFVGVKPEPKVNPNDTTYLPRPEWYFLFMFEFLKFIPGSIEWVGAILIPTIGIVVLLVLPFIDRNPYRHYSKRVLALSVMGLIVLDIVLLTVMALVPAPTPEQVFFKNLQRLAGLTIPGLTLVVLFVLARVVREPASQRKAMLVVTGLAALGMIGASLATVFPLAASAPPKEEEQIFASVSEQIAAGQDLYSTYCAECHGPEGRVTEIQGVEGLDGRIVTAINSNDVMYTFTDETLRNIIRDGWPESGMPPFGMELSPNEIDALVAFMRYTWDDRIEAPAEAQAGGIPALAEGEVPSYDVHIEPIVKRYCLSCHRPGKENNNYLMTSYEEILTTGDNAPNLVAGDMDSILLQVIQGHEVEGKTGTINVMPPNGKLIKDEYVQMFIRWVEAGMPQTADDAAAAAP